MLSRALQEDEGPARFFDSDGIFNPDTHCSAILVPTAKKKPSRNRPAWNLIYRGLQRR
jgi:hypothetical protein